MAYSMLDLLVAFAAWFLLLCPVVGDLCSNGATEIDGNWYCKAVQAIQYSKVGAPGTYSDITGMFPDGTCSAVPKSFSGPISPMDEEISFHFRGPLHLKQFAAYAPTLSSKLTRDAPPNHHRRSAHQHMHKQSHLKAPVSENKRQEISATIDGQVVSWENNWFGHANAKTTGTLDKQIVTATIDGQVVSWTNNWSGSYALVTPNSSQDNLPTTPAQIKAPDASLATSSPDLPTKATNTESSTGSDQVIDNSTVYERIGYYHSESQTVDNLVFLGNYGGQGSGVFDYVFGASLSYINSEANGGASSPQVLADQIIQSDKEVIVMLAQACTDGDCGFVRPGAVGYHGFDGANKVFLLEFSMPDDGSTGFEANMPAIWALNAKIPRTLQYGIEGAECSCWPGCGEFDIAEALDTGSNYLKSTLHDNAPGGDSDYFMRPVSGTMKLAVVFSSITSTIHLQVLPDDLDFSSNITAGEIDSFCASSAANSVSLFAIS